MKACAACLVGQMQAEFGGESPGTPFSIIGGHDRYEEKGGITNLLKFFSKRPMRIIASEPASAAIDPPNAVLSPWRQVRRPLRPDEHPCRQGTLLHYAPPPKTCYTQSSGIQTEDMRIALRFLAILTIAALLAPGVRWASLRGPMEACACPPTACKCAFHHNVSGHVPSCCMGKGGQCGLGSQDNYLNSLLSTLIYVPTEYHWSNPLTPWSFGHDTSDLSLLQSHPQIPEQPPRPTP